MKRISTFLLLVIPAVAIQFAGCGGSGSPFDFVPVSGKVVYEDGSQIPVSGMRIYFHTMEPPKDGMHIRPGVGSVAADGTFKDITSYKYADGLTYGRYKVSLINSERVGDVLAIPKECSLPDKTPLQVEVTESGQFLEIKVPKP